MKYIYAIIGFVSVLYVSNYYANNALSYGFYEENREFIKSTIYFIAFMAALFGYNLIPKDESCKLNKINKSHIKYCYTVISGVISVWVTTFIIAKFFTRASIYQRTEVNIIQVIIVIAVATLGYMQGSKQHHKGVHVKWNYQQKQEKQQ